MILLLLFLCQRKDKIHRNCATTIILRSNVTSTYYVFFTSLSLYRSTLCYVMAFSLGKKKGETWDSFGNQKGKKGIHLRIHEMKQSKRFSFILELIPKFLLNSPSSSVTLLWLSSTNLLRVKVKS